MRIVFFGTPEIAAGVLSAVIAAGYDVCLAVTRADKPSGRGHKLIPSPVKSLALGHGIDVYQPSGIRSPETLEYLRSMKADMFLTVAYGRIFPPEALAIPPLGCVNIHASLLPKLRGASPINRAIINGDTEGGVTVMMMDEGIDTGDMLLVKKTPISDDMYFDEYYEKLTLLGAEAACEYISQAEAGTAVRTPQDGSRATYAEKITRDDEALDLSLPCEAVYDKIRGLSPDPCAYTSLNGKRVKIYKAHKGSGNGTPGCVISAGKGGIELACGSGSVVVTELQPESKGRMTAASFLAGNKLV